jgi:(1->4)-alpha-D-glucan 1-alpha-D-glucosylmutase
MDHLIAYARASHVVTLVPRWNLKLGGNWSGTTIEIPQGKWTNVLTRDVVLGGRHQVNNLLQRFPVALLTKEEE